jgi:NADH:ubiquinone oxidoreductase subunit
VIAVHPRNIHWTENSRAVGPSPVPAPPTSLTPQENEKGSLAGAFRRRNSRPLCRASSARLEVEIDDSDPSLRGILLRVLFDLRCITPSVWYRKPQVESRGLVLVGRFVSVSASCPGGWHGWLHSWIWVGDVLSKTSVRIAERSCKGPEKKKCRKFGPRGQFCPFGSAPSSFGLFLPTTCTR